MPSDAGGARRDVTAAATRKMTSTKAGKSETQGHRGGDAVAVEMLLAMRDPDEASKVRAPDEASKVRARLEGGNTAKVPEVQQADRKATGHTKGTARPGSGAQVSSSPSQPPARSSKRNNFLAALYKMCNCVDQTNCVTWTEDGCTFWVSNTEQVGIRASSAQSVHAALRFCHSPLYPSSLTHPTKQNCKR
jgi:hypothetical protein